MASIILAMDTGAAPQGGTENVACSSPASLSAFQTAAATAQAASGFLQVTTTPNIAGNSETKLVALARIKEVMTGP